MEINKTIFIDIHYIEDEKEKADKIAKRYEQRLYTREADDGECIQLMTTSSVKPSRK